MTGHSQLAQSRHSDKSGRVSCILTWPGSQALLAPAAPPQGTHVGASPRPPAALAALPSQRLWSCRGPSQSGREGRP